MNHSTNKKTFNWKHEPSVWSKETGLERTNEDFQAYSRQTVSESDGLQKQEGKESWQIHTVIPEDSAETRSTEKSLSRSHSQGTGWPNGTRTGLKTRSSEWRVHVWSVLVQSVVSMYEEVTGGVSTAMCKTWRRLCHGSELFQPVYCGKLGQNITADLRTAPPWHMGSLAQLALPYNHVPAPPFSQKDNETNGYFPGSAQVHVPLAEHHKHRLRIVLHIWVCHVWPKKSAFILQLQAPTLIHTNTWCEFNWLT